MSKRFLLLGSLLFGVLFSCGKRIPVVAGPGNLPSSASTKQQPPQQAEIPQVAPPQVVRLPGDRTPAVEKTLGILANLWSLKRGENPNAPPFRFELSEREVNEYLAYALTASHRPGLKAATFHFRPANAVTGFVEIDFASFNAWNTYLIPAFLRPTLLGTRTVQVDAQFKSEASGFQLDVQKAYGPEGTAIPSFIMAAIMQAIGLEQPELFNPGVAMPLPLGLKRVWTLAGSFGGET